MYGVAETAHGNRGRFRLRKSDADVTATRPNTSPRTSRDRIRNAQRSGSSRRRVDGPDDVSRAYSGGRFLAYSDARRRTPALPVIGCEPRRGHCDDKGKACPCTKLTSLQVGRGRTPATNQGGAGHVCLHPTAGVSVRRQMAPRTRKDQAEDSSSGSAKRIVDPGGANRRPGAGLPRRPGVGAARESGEGVALGARSKREPCDLLRLILRSPDAVREGHVIRDGGSAESRGGALSREDVISVCTIHLDRSDNDAEAASATRRKKSPRQDDVDVDADEKDGRVGAGNPGAVLRNSFTGVAPSSRDFVSRAPDISDVHGANAAIKDEKARDKTRTDDLKKLQQPDAVEPDEEHSKHELVESRRRVAKKRQRLKAEIRKLDQELLLKRYTQDSVRNEAEKRLTERKKNLERLDENLILKERHDNRPTAEKILDEREPAEEHERDGYLKQRNHVTRLRQGAVREEDDPRKVNGCNDRTSGHEAETKNWGNNIQTERLQEDGGQPPENGSQTPDREGKNARTPSTKIPSQSSERASLTNGQGKSRDKDNAVELNPDSSANATKDEPEIQTGRADVKSRALRRLMAAQRARKNADARNIRKYRATLDQCWRVVDCGVI